MKEEIALKTLGKEPPKISIDIYSASEDSITRTYSISVQSRDIKTVTLTYMSCSNFIPPQLELKTIGTLIEGYMRTGNDAGLMDFLTANLPDIRVCLH